MYWTFEEEVVDWIMRPHTATVSELQIVHLLSVKLETVILWNIITVLHNIWIYFKM